MESPGPQGTTKEKLVFRANLLAQRREIVHLQCLSKNTWAEVASQVSGGNDTMESEMTQVCSEGKEVLCLTLCGISSCPDRYQNTQFRCRA